MRNCGREIIRNKKVKKNQIKVLTKLKQSDNINKSSAMSNNADMTKKNMERYRSGHNGAVLKTVCLHGRMGSNPILSAKNHLYVSGSYLL